MPVQTQVHIVGLKQLNRELARAGGKPLKRELGEVHKGIGQMVISHLGGKQTQVGEGRGETIRPSAATANVMLRVGGSHRDRRKEQWGREQVWPGGMPPARPHLIGAAREIQPQIEDAYLDGVEHVLRGAGLK